MMLTRTFLDISVNPHLNTNNNSQCSPSASSTQTTVIGNWQDVYVYGYYQTVLEANMPFSELAASNVALIYEPYVSLFAHFLCLLKPQCLFLEISLHKANTIFMQRRLAVLAVQIASSALKSNTICNCRLVLLAPSHQIRIRFQIAALCCIVDSFPQYPQHSDPRLHSNQLQMPLNQTEITSVLWLIP